MQIASLFWFAEEGERVEGVVQFGDGLVVGHTDVRLGPSFGRREVAFNLTEVGQLRAYQFEGVVRSLDDPVGELEPVLPATAAQRRRLGSVGIREPQFQGLKYGLERVAVGNPVLE